ncbi:MAG: hypothetical protein QM805_07715 [Pseudomonas sp.]
MIENSDRGFTINKSLGWTILVSLIGLVWWGGTTLTSLQAATMALTAALQDTRAVIAQDRTVSTQMEVRIRALETQAGRTDEKLSNILSSVTRIERQLEDGK